MAIMSGDNQALNSLARRFEEWLCSKMPAGATPKVTGFRHASDSNGYSNETYRVAVSSALDAMPLRLIVRLAPIGDGLFQCYDMGRQYAFMRAIEVSNVPSAPCRWLEQDPRPLGQPFLVMDHVDGMIASDTELYIASGWLAEAGPSDRARAWWSTIDGLARLANIDPAEVGLSAHDWPDPGRSRMAQVLEFYDGNRRWAAQGLPTIDHPEIDRLRSWLDENMPQATHAGIVWGDARLGNVIFRDFHAVAFLDWELAYIGDPEMDLAYFLMLQYMTELAGGQAGVPANRLEGFASDSETIARYASNVGRPVTNLRYYWLFNAYRAFTWNQRLAALRMARGDLTKEEAVAFTRMPSFLPSVVRVLDGLEPSALTQS